MDLFGGKIKWFEIFLPALLGFSLWASLTYILYSDGFDGSLADRAERFLIERTLGSSEWHAEKSSLVEAFSVSDDPGGEATVVRFLSALKKILKDQPELVVVRLPEIFLESSLATRNSIAKTLKSFESDALVVVFDGESELQGMSYLGGLAQVLSIDGCGSGLPIACEYGTTDKQTSLQKVVDFYKKLKVDGDVYLCRCGDSKKAPFCDGTHSQIGFTGAHEGGYDHGPKEWQGKRIKTTFNPNICMHAGVCRKLAALRKAEPEDQGLESAKNIMKVVRECPSGALTYELIDSELSSSKPQALNEGEEVQVRIKEGGEIQVSCDFTPTNFQLVENQPGDRVTLCRCGLSKNKPFCDANHDKKEGFV